MVIYQQLQAIAPRIAEQENVAALGIAAQMVAHQTVQTIKSLAHVRGSGGHVDPRRWPKSEHRLYLVQHRQQALQCGPIEAPVHFDPASAAQPHHQPAAAARRAPARCPYLYRQQPITCPASLILGTLFSQMTIESTSRDPSTAAEFTLWHAARCKF